MSINEYICCINICTHINIYIYIYIHIHIHIYIHTCNVLTILLHSQSYMSDLRGGRVVVRVVLLGQDLAHVAYICIYICICAVLYHIIYYIS